MLELADHCEKNLFFLRKAITILRPRSLHRNSCLCKEDHELYGKFLRVKMRYSGYLYSHLIKPCLNREKHESRTKKAIGYRFFHRRKYRVHEERPVMNFWFYVGVHLKSCAVLSAEDSSTILQLKYDLSVLPLPPALKMSFESFPPLCMLLFFKTLLRRASVYIFQYHFSLLSKI